MLVEEKDALKESLKEIFGYSQFRGNQERVIRNLLNGKNTFVIMPTGAGKSLCYQLPAMVREGLRVVAAGAKRLVVMAHGGDAARGRTHDCVVSREALEVAAEGLAGIPAVRPNQESVDRRPDGGKIWTDRSKRAPTCRLARRMVAVEAMTLGGSRSPSTT